MVVMCESPEAMTQLFNNKITKTLNDLEGGQIYVTAAVVDAVPYQTWWS
jgi:hypothetical protein